MGISINDIKWMQLAIQQAIEAQELNEVPVGAVLIKDEQLIAGSHNKLITNNDPSAHAEILTLRQAGEKINNYRLNNTTLYVTLEPCTMCFGAMVHARIERIVFGAYDKKTGVCGSCANLNDSAFFNHKMIITAGVLEQKCGKILTDFFSTKRTLQSKKNKVN